jgi:prevent-host-death family protein
MKIVNVQEAKTHLSRLIDEVVAGGEVILGKHGKPLARLTAFSLRSAPRPLGGWEGKITIAPDFDEEDARIQTLFHS